MRRILMIGLGAAMCVGATAGSAMAQDNPQSRGQHRVRAKARTTASAEPGARIRFIAPSLLMCHCRRPNRLHMLR